MQTYCLPGYSLGLQLLSVYVAKEIDSLLFFFRSVSLIAFIKINILSQFEKSLCVFSVFEHAASVVCSTRWCFKLCPWLLIKKPLNFYQQSMIQFCQDVLRCLTLQGKQIIILHLKMARRYLMGINIVEEIIIGLKNSILMIQVLRCYYLRYRLQ